MKSFEHCIEQVVRFHFPSERNVHFTHWNAKRHSIDPLWVRASIIEFVKSFKGSFKGMFIARFHYASRSKQEKRWTNKKEKTYQELRNFIEDLVLKHAGDEQDLSVLFF